MFSLKFKACVFVLIATVNFYGSIEARKCYVCQNCNEVTDEHIQTCPPRPITETTAQTITPSTTLLPPEESEITTTQPPVEPEITTTQPPVEPEITTTQPPVEPEITTTQPPVEPEITTTQPPVEPEITTTPPPVEPEITTTQPPVEPEITTTQLPVEPEITTTQPPVEPEITTTQPPVEPEITTTPPPVEPEITTTPPPVEPEITTMQPPVEPEISTTQPPVEPEITTTPPPVEPEITTTQTPEESDITQPTESPVVPLNFEVIKRLGLDDTHYTYINMNPPQKVFLRTLKQLRTEEEDEESDAVCTVTSFEENGETIIVRGCGFASEEPEHNCRAAVGDFTGNLNSCRVCNDDLCNSAATYSTGVIVLLVGVVINLIVTQ